MLSLPRFQMLKIDYEDIYRILTVTFNRPEKLNAINDLMKRELIALLDWILSNEDYINVIIFTGAGKSFTSGADIEDWRMEIEGKKARSKFPSEFALRMSKIFIPVICAINGLAVGFGFNLLLWSDYVIASSEVKFIWPVFAKRGISTELGSSFLAPRVIGFRKAKQLYIVAEPLTADDAKQLGVVDEVCPSDKLLEEAKAIARRIAENAPLAVKANKRLITESMYKTILESIKFEEEIAEVTYSSEDYIEAVKAFFEKRKPIFKGK